MDALIKSDLFFFIASVGFILFGIIGAIVGIYLIILVRDARTISRIARQQVELFSNTLDDVRADIVSRGRGLSGLLGWLSSLARPITNASKKYEKKYNKKNR